jgi:predicted dehydrogenase
MAHSSQEKHKLRAAVIACGRISRAHAHGYRANSEIELVACADISREALDAFGEQFSVPPEKRYLDYNEMLDKEKPDIVSVCSHHQLHASMTIDAAKRKPRAIFCEKPIALSLGEADDMIEACQKAGALLIIGHQRRFSPQYVSAYNALRAGEIGELQFIEGHGHPGTSLTVDGTHTVDLMRWYAGDVPVEWVFGQIDFTEHHLGWGAEVENAAMAIFSFNTGVRGILTLGGKTITRQNEKRREPIWPNIAGGNYHHIILRGPKGVIEIDGDSPTEGRPWVRLIKNGAVQALPVEWNPDVPNHLRSAHAHLVRLMLDSLETGAIHPLDASNARATLEVLMAVCESSRRREVIQLPLDVRENPLFEMLKQEQT